MRPELGAQRLTRAAWRAARRLGAELDIVMPEGRLDDEAARQRDLVRSLAVTLGAHFIPVPQEDLADAVVSLAEERGVTRLAMATPRAARAGRRGCAGDLLSTLLERLEGVDVLLIADRRAGPTAGGADDAARRVLVATRTSAAPRRPSPGGRPRRPGATSCSRRCWWCRTLSRSTPPSTAPWRRLRDARRGRACEDASAGAFDTRLVRARSFAEGMLETLDAERFDLLLVEKRDGAVADDGAAQIASSEKAAPAVMLVRPARRWSGRPRRSGGGAPAGRCYRGPP